MRLSDTPLDRGATVLLRLRPYDTGRRLQFARAALDAAIETARTELELLFGSGSCSGARVLARILEPGGEPVSAAASALAPLMLDASALRQLDLARRLLVAVLDEDDLDTVLGRHQARAGQQPAERIAQQGMAALRAYVFGGVA